MSPLDYISFWDFFIMFLSVILRFLGVFKHKSEENGCFSFRNYFDFKHSVRWTFHVLASIVGILVLPQVFVKIIQPQYLPKVEDWVLLGSAIIGFAGYDLIKWLEKLVIFGLGKIGIKL
jgi:hypothetical protein